MCSFYDFVLRKPRRIHWKMIPGLKEGSWWDLGTYQQDKEHAGRLVLCCRPAHSVSGWFLSQCRWGMGCSHKCISFLVLLIR